MTDFQTDAVACAQRWYGTHQAHYLSRDRDRMVDACTRHLQGIFDISTVSATHVAHLALAELDADRVPGFIDIDRSTSSMLMLRDSTTGVSHMFTLPELFELALARSEFRRAA